jgi:hypothetical protein
MTKLAAKNIVGQVRTVKVLARILCCLTNLQLPLFGHDRKKADLFISTLDKTTAIKKI